MERDLSDFSAATGGARMEWKHGLLSAYIDLSAMDTFYSDYLFLDSRLALIAQLGFRVAL